MRLVYLALGWVAGILLASTTSALIPLFWLLGMSAMVFATSIGWGGKRGWYLAAIVAFFAGGYWYQLVPQTSHLAQFNTVGSATIEGQIVSEPDIRDDRIQIRVRATTINLGVQIYDTDGLLLVNAPRTADVNYGDTVSVTGRINTPAVYDTFSYADFLAREGIFTVMDNAVVEVIETGGGNIITRHLLALKARMQAKINANLPDPQAALISGILLGNERGLDPKLSEDFTRVGAAHIIAISGFNMAIIAGILMGFGKYVPSHKWLIAWFSIGLLILYTLLVGANAAVVRAAIMSSMLIIAETSRRKTFVPASLAATIIFMSLQNPSVLWDISFQLSFFAVLGLALFTEPLTRYFDSFLERVFPNSVARVIASFLNEPLIVSIAALALTLPLTMFYFQRLSLVSLLVNILVVPIQSYVLIIGGLALLISFIAPPVGQVLFWINYVLLSWTILNVRVFGDWQYADIAFGLNGRIVWIFFGLIIGGAILRAARFSWAQRFEQWIRQKKVVAAIIVCGLCIGALMVQIQRSRPNGNLHVWWLDVGHSHAVLIETPNGSHILVDGGRFPSRLLTSIGDRLPFHDRTLELVIITHPDEFDTAALPAVLERYDAGTVITNGQPNLSESAAELNNAIAPYPMLTGIAGQTIEFEDGTLIEILHPTTTPTINDNLSDGVLVLRVSYGEVSFLITSDLSVTGQRTLLENGHWPLATVMALPQHGTQRSLDEVFLEAVQAQAIVLQSDIANRRGDPDLNIISMVEDKAVYRTDVDGTLHFWTDGSALWYLGQG